MNMGQRKLAKWQEDFQTARDDVADATGFDEAEQQHDALHEGARHP